MIITINFLRKVKGHLYNENSKPELIKRITSVRKRIIVYRF
jgi:hypothetical protein